MKPTKCCECGSQEITYYRQIRADGITVVTARCANDHHPLRGHPFYSVLDFNLDTLDLLPSQRNDPIAKQVEMFKAQEKEVKQIYKYPPMPRPKSNGRNFLEQVDE